MFTYPQEIVRIVGPSIENAKRAVRFHFARRAVNGKKPVRAWIAELRRIDANSGYSIALAQVNARDIKQGK